VNNSVLGEPPVIEVSCLIVIATDCGFRECLFVRNHLSQYLAGSWLSPRTVTFWNCIFDRVMTDDLFTITFHLVSFDVVTDSGILEGPRLCPATIPLMATLAAPTPAFTSFARIALHRIRFVRSVVFTWPLFDI
jgi:hypothetical protein